MTVVVPEPEPLVTIAGIEILRAGTWDIAAGPQTFTMEDLAAAVAAMDCPGVRNPTLKLGHDEPRTDGSGNRWDGEPGVGWVANMRLTDEGATIVGDYMGVPYWLAEVMPSAYPDRSSESIRDYLCQVGHLHPFVIVAVALLGVTRPGIGNLNSLQDVMALYGVATITAAAAQKGTAVPTIQINAAVSSEDIRRKYFEAGAPWSMWITEVQVDPPQLIVADDMTGKLYRVPYTITGDEIAFGAQQEVAVEYVDKAPIAAAISAGKRLRFTDRVAGGARELKASAIGSHTTATDTATWDGPGAKANLSNDAGASTYRKAFAYVDPDADPDTKAAYKFIHHFVADDGTVGAASTMACSSGIGILNGGRGGTNIPADSVQGVYNHLAKHLRDADMEPPELMASAPDGHDHQEGGGHVPTLTDEQVANLRQVAGLPDGETDLDKIYAAAMKRLGGGSSSGDGSGAGDGDGEPGTTTGRKPSSGVVYMDESRLAAMEERIAASERQRKRWESQERDRVIEAAVSAGKFSRARVEHWQTAWDKDPDGTRAEIELLAAGRIPVDMIGQAGGEPTDADLDAEFAHLWPAGQQWASVGPTGSEG